MKNHFTLLTAMLFICNCSSKHISNNNKPMPTHPTCQEGTVREGYLQPSTGSNSPCPTGTQICVNNNWQGPMLFNSCENHTRNCEGHLHGSTISGFITPVAPCVMGTKTCIDGSWSGPEVFEHCQENK